MWKVEGVNQVPYAQELLAGVIGGNPEELHVCGDDRNRLKDDFVGSHIHGVDGGDCSGWRGVRNVEHEQERFGPGGEPAIGSLEAFGRQDECMECRKCSGKDGGVVHGLHHGNVQLQVVGGSVWGVCPGLVRSDCEGARGVSREVVEPVVAKASSEGGFERRQWAALFSDARNENGVS